MIDFKNDTIKFASEFLSLKGNENAFQESKWLFEHVFGKSEKSAHPARVRNSKRFNELVLRRSNGEPLQYLLGEWEFYGYPMIVGEGVLIPRPETEFLIDAGKQHLAVKKAALIAAGKTEEADSLGGESLILIDLCAGSGCVGAAMCLETDCTAYCVEISDEAITYAQKNIKLNHLEEKMKITDGDIFDTSLIERLPMADFIFANPPYLSDKDMENLQREVSFEPKTALYGGGDGLDFYRRIFKLWKPKLKKGGLFAVETGDGQAQSVAEFMKEAGFNPLFMRDYANIDRIVYSENK